MLGALRAAISQDQELLSLATPEMMHQVLGQISSMKGNPEAMKRAMNMQPPVELPFDMCRVDITAMSKQQLDALLKNVAPIRKP